MTDTTVTTSSGVDNPAVQLSTIDLTTDGDKKNAQIILSKRTNYSSNLDHYQKVYSRWYYTQLAVNWTAHLITFVSGVLLGIQFYMPASPLMVAVLSPINVVIPSVYCLLHIFLFQPKVSRFGIVIKSLQDYINQIAIFYNKAVQDNTITDTEMTSFTSLVGPFDKQLTNEVNLAISNPIDGTVITEIKDKINTLINEIETIRTTKVKTA